MLEHAEHRGQPFLKCPVLGCAPALRCFKPVLSRARAQLYSEWLVLRRFLAIGFLTIQKEKNENLKSLLIPQQRFFLRMYENIRIISHFANAKNAIKCERKFQMRMRCECDFFQNLNANAMRMRFFRIASHRICKMRNSQCEFTSLIRSDPRNASSVLCSPILRITTESSHQNGSTPV